MDFNDWLSSLPGSPTPTIAANKAGLTNTTLIRHATKGQTTADNVIAIARAYGVRPVDALIATGHLEPEEAASERMAIRMALRSASIAEKWDSIAEDIDGMHVVVGHFPRAHELDIAKFDDTSTPDVSPIDDDDDAIIERINAGQEQIAAQKATDPLEENYT
ncbi:hypothetical protein [Corynebacterium lipophiloflavum]|nr:hypothetical protein [Corynebacterium lipophiloflavum]